MTTKAESDLLTAVLTANKPVDGDLKFFMDKIVTGKTGTVKLVELDWHPNITSATFSTKRKVKKTTRSKELVELSFKLEVSVEDDYNYSRRKSKYRTIKVQTTRGGYKGETKYSDNSNYWHNYATRTLRTFIPADRDELNIDELIDQVITKTIANVKTAAANKLRAERHEAREKQRLTDNKAEILAEHGLVECAIVNKAYDRASIHTWGNKSQIRRNFAFFAELLKATPELAKKEEVKDGE